MNEKSERCPTHHYLTGWCCQLDKGHAGPCMADASGGIKGLNWAYAWHQPEGEPACNQSQCPNPRACTC